MRQKQWLQDNNYTKDDLSRIVVYTYTYRGKVIFVGRGKLKYAFFTQSFARRYPKFKEKIKDIVLSIIAIDITMAEANKMAKELRFKHKDTICKTNSHSKNAKKVKNRPAKFKEKPVYVFTRDGTYVKRCKSIGEASRQFNTSYTAVRYCAIGKHKYANSHIFSYTKECIPFIDNKQYRISIIKEKPLLKIKVK